VVSLYQVENIKRSLTVIEAIYRLLESNLDLLFPLQNEWGRRRSRELQAVDWLRLLAIQKKRDDVKRLNYAKCESL
jgi:hypothetical protein